MTAGAGVGLGVLVTHGHMTFAQGLEAGVNVLPIELLFIGAGVLFLAFAPRLGIGLLYALVVVGFVWELFGALLSFPSWLLDFSPYHQLAPAPAKPIAVAPALAMVAIAAVATIVGAARFRHRDPAGD